MEKIVVSKEEFVKSYQRKAIGAKLVKQIRWLPLPNSPELAALVGYILSDGTIEHSYERSSKIHRPKRIDFISPNRVIQKKVKDIFQKIFKIKPKFHYFRDTLGLRINDANVARALWLCGIPMGDKASQEYDVPKWIKNGTQIIKSSFLRSYFDGDGSTPYEFKRSKASFGIRLTLNKIENKIKSGIKFLNSIKKMLKEFDIESLGPYQRKICYRKNNAKTIMLELIICRQNSILNFYRYINFCNPEKKSKLNFCVRKILSNYNPRK
jgi:intein/homing endonuclease